MLGAGDYFAAAFAGLGFLSYKGGMTLSTSRASARAIVMGGNQ